MLDGIILSFLFLYNSEVFTTQVRAMTLGIVFFLARQVSSFVPFLVSFVQKLNMLFLIIYFPFAILAFLAHFVLPETRKK